MKYIKNISVFVSLILLFFTGCGSMEEAKEDTTTILVAAAASLRNPFENELKSMYKEMHSDTNVIFTFDSSGKLQTQIEEGADVDIFFSAAEKQMNELKEEGLIKKESVVNLLQNQIVLIAPINSKSAIQTFSDILEAEEIAIGDPESVPVGQYTKELYEKMGIWDQVLEKASLGTNVTEVLNWVSEESADVGIVYATDAAAESKVKVIEEATEDQVSSAIYPVGMVNSSKKQKQAKEFIDFLSLDQVAKVFQKYGFTLAK